MFYEMVESEAPVYDNPVRTFHVHTRQIMLTLRDNGSSEV